MHVPSPQNHSGEMTDPPARPVQESPKILIVDDRSENLTAMEKVLSQLKCNIMKASSGAEALTLMIREDISLVLMDVQMPEMDGFETARIMMQNERTQQIPIIFVTAINKEASYAFEGYKSGGIDYIFKPIEPKILRSKVNVFMDLFHEKRELQKEIHERILVEKRIKVLNEELERRVRERTKQLEDINKELEAFAHSVSHDLRSPLNHIKGFISLLQKHLGNTVDSKSQQYIDIIQAGTEKMHTLIDDLLEFSKMSQTDLRKSNVDFNRLIISLLGDFQHEVVSRQISINLSPLPSALADPSLFRQVWVNLLSNAIKYSKNNPRPEITIGTTQDANELIYFIKDNGAGFNMEYYDKLFTVFQRLHPDSQFEGTGVGLATVRRIVAKHGGRVWATSSVGQGSTFYVSLPLQSEN